LAKSGMTSMYNQEMWTAADSKTAKYIKQYPAACAPCGGGGGGGGVGGTATATAAAAFTWQDHHGVVKLPASAVADEKEILVWTGSFKHGLYGSELVCTF
jgi:hypothetical protein